MFSWPAFFGAALVIWLLLRGPAAETPIWVQKACHAAMAFFLYGGFLYLLKWTTFWRVMPATGLDRTKTEGFLILISTLVWLIVTLRILLRGFRLSGHAFPVHLENLARDRKALAFHVDRLDSLLLFFQPQVNNNYPNLRVTNRSSERVPEELPP